MAERPSIRYPQWKKLLVFCVLAAILLVLPLDGAPADPPSAGWSALVPPRKGRNFYVAPNGKRANSGSVLSPWDLKSCLNGTQKISAGDVIWVRGGIYKGSFKVQLQGEKGNPVHVRSYPGERATILDSSTNVLAPAKYLWIWDLEFASSVPVQKRHTTTTGSHPKDFPVRDGLQIVEGLECKFINLVVHDNVGNGISWWTPSVNGEIHGCLIYNNGWSAPDRTHGHCIYTQNRNGIKTISGCILTVPSWGGLMTMHAYGSRRAWVDNFLIHQNIAFERGRFLVGGSRPSRNIRIVNNFLYGIDMQVGYDAPYNENCEVKDNVLIGGKMYIKNYKKVVKNGNVFNVDKTGPVLIKNKYDPFRAYAAIYNPSNDPQSVLSVDGFLKRGDAYRVLDPKNFFGTAVAEGICHGTSIVVPMHRAFEALVILKK